MLLGIILVKINTGDIVGNLSDIIVNIIIIEVFHKGNTVTIIKFTVVIFVKIFVVKSFLSGFCFEIMEKIVEVNPFETGNVVVIEFI